MIKVVAIGRCGNSFRVVISKRMAVALGWSLGDFVSLSDTDSKSVVVAKVPRELVIKASPRARARINELFAHVSGNGSGARSG